MANWCYFTLLFVGCHSIAVGPVSPWWGLECSQPCNVQKSLARGWPAHLVDSQPTERRQQLALSFSVAGGVPAGDVGWSPAFMGFSTGFFLVVAIKNIIRGLLEWLYNTVSDYIVLFCFLKLDSKRSECMLFCFAFWLFLIIPTKEKGKLM